MMNDFLSFATSRGMDSIDSQRDIRIYLNTPGGSVSSGLGIYDTMQFVRSEVGTTCTGMAASMGAEDALAYGVIDRVMLRK